MIFEAMIFDLDDTLYPSTSGLWNALGLRIERYMHEKVHIPTEEVPQLRSKLFHEYGTTMSGLVQLYHVDAENYLEFVHDVDLSRFLQPNPSLRAILSQYPQRKIVFTNASAGHAQRVIAQLGLNGIFDQVVDVLSVQPYCKPQKGAFQIAFNLSGISSPGECVMLDDSINNLQVAREFGMYTVQVGVMERKDGVDAAIPSLLDLPTVVPAGT